MANANRKARVLALQVLYEADSTSHSLPATLDRSVLESGMTEERAALTRELVEGVAANRQRLDAIIQEHAPSWPVDQLSAVDRNILRIAIFEILMNNRTPPKAAINEAVELSKTFGGENIHRFINGVLGSVMARLGAEQETPTGRT